MTRRLLSLVVGGTLLLIGVARPHAAEKSLAVFVTAAQVEDVTKLDKATEQNLQSAIKNAGNARRALEKELKAQHGKKREDWPAEAQGRLEEAEENEAIATADWGYRKVKQEGLSDTAEDIRKSIMGDGTAGKKDHITLVTSPADAELIVEVTGRRSSYGGVNQGLMALRDDQFFINLVLKAGPKLPAERFAAIPKTYRMRRLGHQAFRLAPPRPETPFWRFEPYGMIRWGAAANTASVLIEDFIDKNYDAMAAAAPR
jgi:hypothetical protein